MSEDEIRLDTANDNAHIQQQDLRDYSGKYVVKAFSNLQNGCRKRQSSKSSKIRKSSIPSTAVGCWNGWNIKRASYAVCSFEENILIDETEVRKTEGGRNGKILKVDDCSLGRNSGKLMQVYDLLKQCNIRFKTY